MDLGDGIAARHAGYWVPLTALQLAFSTHGHRDYDGPMRDVAAVAIED